ncbi:CamS family sex pheromone protein [Salipaludibacillus daqingensis]|uniref:CamS family sex pheromone protein n=1 Tax=Salipaludibacillus daqingensis TaxID=3041001 RepID=UPI00247610AB|nr:CamS family sex pheromone protein [Salipaludibacillus daqingensis]
MKKWNILSLSFVILLTGCIPALERSEEDVIIVEETEEEEEQQYVITPTIDSPDNFYRNVLRDGKYHRSEARGNVAHAMENRVDLNQFEMGLIEIASGFYDQEDYYFQEGQHLDGSRINSWLRRYDPDEDGNQFGLNPSLGDGDDDEERMRSNPLVLSHIMEHNYFYGNEEEGVNLGGVVIGLSLRSVYYFRTVDEDGGYYFHEEPLDPEETLEQGREIAQEILERMRAMEGLEEVPITFALYQEEERGSVAPGSFVSMGNVESGQSEIQGWESINEDFIVFPSQRARNDQPNLSSNFSQFREEIEEFFDRTVGVVGKGRYKNDMLEELKIELNIQSHGKAEIIALTQFISGRVESTFATQVPIHIYVESVNGPESIIIQYADQEPYIHIYK